MTPQQRIEEVFKLAKLKTELQPHQQRVVDRIQGDDQPGLVVVHGLGSGKTLTAIAAQEGLGRASQVVAPAALLGNYAKEREKHLEGPRQKTQLVSMQNMAAKGVPPSAPVLIVDEAHRARDPSSATFQTLKGNSAEKRLLLTGSPFYNHPSDIAPLVNLAADAKILPYEKDDFARHYITEQTVKPGLWDRFVHGATPGTVPVLHEKMAPELKQHFAKWVDYHPGSTENFPTVEHRDVNVPMSGKQLEIYDTLMDKAPAWVAAKVKRGLPPDKREAQQLNAFLTAARQAANSTAPFAAPGESAEQPKIDAAFKNLQATLAANPRAKAVVYSNYLDAGINPYKKKLDDAGIPYGEFTGEMNRSARDRLVQDYNAGKIRSLLLSSAGGEGLDLKGTRLLQVLDPHWNQEKIKQVEGRGARYMSHADLPADEQKLLVERYLSTRPQGLVSSFANKLTGRKPDKSVDEYLSQMSTDKERLIGQFRALLPNQPVEKTSSAAYAVWCSKSAAATPATAESNALASSWKPRLAAEATYTLPGVLTGASMGSALGRAAGDARLALTGGALGGALGGAFGHTMARGVQDDLVRSGKTLAREAVRKPQKEVALREGAENLNWGDVGRSAAGRTLFHAPMVARLGLGGLPVGPDIAAGVASTAAGSIGSGYLDKYRRQIAVNELDNARVEEAQRDAEKLHRLRRQVSTLESRVEGDGWKKTPIEAAPAVPKDKSGKDW